MDNEKSFRHIAYKFSIKKLNQAPFIRQEGWEPSYFLINNIKVSRVNLIGVVINKTQDLTPFIIIDDGTSTIMIKSFEEDLIKPLNIGEIVFVVGRARRFMDENYIVAEIIKTVNEKALILRKKELYYDYLVTLSKHKKPEKEEIFKKEEKDNLSGQEKIIHFIREHDRGDGVDIEKVLSEITIEDAETIINKLILLGEIYEVRPGKLRCIE